MVERLPFEEEINEHKNAAEVSTEVTSLETEDSSLDIRLRGAFITKCELTSPTTGLRVDVLYAEPELDKPKITATHSMVPAGPYEGIGGQHGFPRWADYHRFSLEDGPDGAKRLAVQARRSDNGLSLVKSFELANDSLITHTTISNPGATTEQTSMGEHMYFSLANEDFNGLKVNGKSLDELLGEGSQHTVENDGTLHWDFGGEATIEFPAGYSLRVSADFEGDSAYRPAMWIWKRPGSPSICFEPVVGVDKSGNERSGVQVPADGKATLSTKIELL